jgi:hypothetical protein
LRGAPTPLQEFQGGWEQGCSINIRDKEEVGSTEDKDKDKDNRVRDSKDKDNIVKDWGLPSEAEGGLGEGKEGEEK